MNITEKELVRLCKRKNASAQKLLYNTYHSSLLGICMRYGKSKDEAEDILQLGMIQIFKSIGSYSGKGSFEGWMKRIVLNIAIDNFRKNNKYYYHHDIDEINGESYFASDIPDNLEVKDLLHTVQQLPDGYRMVLIFLQSRAIHIKKFLLNLVFQRILQKHNCLELGKV